MVKKDESFMISAVRAWGERCLFEGGAYSRAALINFFVPDVALI